MTRRILPLIVLLAACNKGADDTAIQPAIPLAVSIDSPGTGHFTDQATVTVDGDAQGTGATFSLNQAELTPAEGGYTMSTDHASVTWPDSPLWPVLAHGQDDDGWLRDRVTLVHGVGVPAGDAMPDALVLRMTDVLIADFQPIIEEELLGFDIATELAGPDPVADIAGQKIYIDAATVDSLEVGDLDFQTAGLAWGFTIHEITADLRIESFLGNEDGTIAAERIDIDGHLVFGADETGKLIVTPMNTNVVITGLDIQGFESALIDALINNFLGGFIGAEIEKQLVEQFESVLAFQDELRQLELGGVTLNNDFTSAVHDDNGANIYAATTITTEAGPLTTMRLSNPNPRAAVTTAQFDGLDYGAAILLDDDALSGLGVGLFEGGLLEQTIDSEAAPISLTTTTLGGFVEAFQQLPPDLEVTIVTAPELGFPASPGTAAPEAARLNVGGMGLDFLVDVDGTGTPTSQMTVVVDVIVGLMGGENIIDFELVEIDATMTQTPLDVDDPAATEEALAGMFGILLPGLLGDALTGGLGGEEGGFLDGIEPVGSGPEGTGGDYAAMYFNLDPEVLVGGEEPPP